MEAYQQALAAAPVAIGASKRSKPGSVSAAIAEYYGSQHFRGLTGGTPAKRRTILERLREAWQHAARIIAERVCRRAARYDEANGCEQLAHSPSSLLPVVRAAQASARRSDLGHPLQAAEVGRAPHLDRRRD